MSKKKRFVFMVSIMSGMILAGQTSSFAAGTAELRHEDGACAGRSGGGDVPTPFEATDAKFELADGEIYLLTGRVELMPSLMDDSGSIRPYLAVNLTQYPWLANAKRTESPYYVLEGTSRKWKAWDRFPVKLLCRAHGRIVTIGGKLQYRITLEVL